jgi:hypothetical protein
MSADGETMTGWVRGARSLAAVTLAVIAVAAVAAYGHLGLRHVEVATPGAAPVSRPVASPSAVPGTEDGTSFLAWLILTVIAVLSAAASIAVFAAMLAGRLRSASSRLIAWWRHGVADPPPTTGTPDIRRADVLAAVDSGLAGLADDDTDPRGAVIACWVRLEAVAASAGIDAGPSATSSDLVASLLDGQHVSADALATLADIYRDARYSRHVIEVAMRDRARAALERLRVEIAAGTGAVAR